MKVCLAAFDGMEELDLVGPWQVLRMLQWQHAEDDVDGVHSKERSRQVKKEMQYDPKPPV